VRSEKNQCDVLGAMFSAGALPFKTTRFQNYSLLANSLFAIRYSLPFFFRLADLPTSRLADNLARQEFRPPIFSGYATFGNLPKFLTAEGGEGDAPLSVGALGVDGIVGNRSRSGGLVITR
jgi:hypothetical protein